MKGSNALLPRISTPLFSGGARRLTTLTRCQPLPEITANHHQLRVDISAPFCQDGPMPNDPRKPSPPRPRRTWCVPVWKR